MRLWENLGRGRGEGEAAGPVEGEGAEAEGVVEVEEGDGEGRGADREVLDEVRLSEGVGGWEEEEGMSLSSLTWLSRSVMKLETSDVLTR